MIAKALVTAADMAGFVSVEPVKEDGVFNVSTSWSDEFQVTVSRRTTKQKRQDLEELLDSLN